MPALKGPMLEIAAGRTDLPREKVLAYRAQFELMGLELPPIDEEWDVTKPSRGLGDTVAKFTTKIGIRPCGGCKQRQGVLNRLVPFQRKAPAPARNSRSPWIVAPGTPRFITTAQLMDDAKTLASKLPADTVEIIGIARSGLCVATMVAMLLHRPLNIFRQSKNDLIEGGNGWRLSGGVGAGVGKGTTVVIDDTCMTGNSFKHVMPLVRQQRPNAVSAAVYVNPSARQKPDLWAVDLPWPHLLEWNLFNSVLSPAMAVDFDGILCHDCAPQDDDDGPRYANFLETVRPLYLSRKVAVPLIVTARLEKYRPQTMAWLARHGVTVRNLVMGPWANNAERARGDVAGYKATHFAEFLKKHRGIKPALFVESDRRQAERIAQISKGLVVCPAAGRCFKG